MSKTFINVLAIKKFVQEKLGCKCSEEVFNCIRVGVPSLFSVDNELWDIDMVIGNKLLICIKNNNKNILDSLKYSIKIRDDNKLNRVRLVFMFEPNKEDKEIIKSFSYPDEKIHIHFIND